MAQRPLERLGELGRRALARCSSRWCAVQAEQRGVVVGREHDLRTGQPCERIGQVRAARRREAATAARARPPRASTAARAVAPRAASMPAPASFVALPPTPTTTLRRALLDGDLEQLADTPGAGEPRVALVGAEEVQATRLGAST